MASAVVLTASEAGGLPAQEAASAGQTWSLADLTARYPAVEAVLFFPVAGDQTVTCQKVDWSMAADSVVAGTVAGALRSWGAPR